MLSRLPQSVDRSVRTGIAAMPEVEWGSYLCHFYRDADELLDVLVPFYRAGLQANDKCLWIAAPPCPASAARAALAAVVPDLDRYERRGQIEIIDYRDWYQRGGARGPAEIVAGWLEHEATALADGFRGLRLSGNPPWLDRDSWAAFADYEGRVHQAFHARQIVAMCSYAVAQCGRDGIVDVLRNHKLALVRRGREWEVARSATAVLSLVEARSAEPIADGHTVQFYNSDFPAAAVARFLADGVAANQGAVVIATPEHRRAIIAALAELALDTAALETRRQLVFADADATLARLCVGDEPKLELLQQHIAPILIDLRRRFASVRAFGEMVNLLAADGRIAQACALESRWNELLAAHPAQLLCGYDLAAFDNDSESGGFHAVCHTHAAVHSDEPAAHAENARLVAELQQKTRVIRASAKRLALLHKTTEALSEAVTTRDVARVIVRDVKSVAGAQTILCALLDEERARLRVAGHDGVAAAQLARIEGAAVDASLPLLAPLQSGVPSWDERSDGFDVCMPLGVPARRLGFLAFGFTPARALSLELRALIEDLVRQSSIALDRARVYEEATQARARAEEASRAKDEFLAMLGHELRNPLSPIVTALQLMKLRGHGGSSKEQEIIERQMQHLIRLVDDLLDVSRVARGKIEIKRQPLALADVIASAVEMASALFEQRQHRLRVVLPKERVQLLGDETRLVQVFSNLLGNAAKYTPPGGRITVSAALDGHDVVVRVSDNGVGIEGELLERVFDLFVQGKRSADRSEGGLGLGLALVRSLVELHGGRVEARSDGAGEGSEFSVRLPALAVATSSASQPGAGAADLSPAAGKSVLVVDDNVDGAELLAEMLRLAGHTVEVAHDGLSALTKIQRCRFDVAILDIGLPAMDGYELASNITKHHGAAAPRLIALTGYGQTSDRDRSAEAGFDEHMVKPLDPEKIYRAVDAARAS